MSNAQYLCQAIEVSKHKLIAEIDSLLDVAMSCYMKRGEKLQELRTILKYLESLVQVLKKMQTLESLDQFDARLLFSDVDFSEEHSQSFPDDHVKIFRKFKPR